MVMKIKICGKIDVIVIIFSCIFPSLHSGLVLVKQRNCLYWGRNLCRECSLIWKYCRLAKARRWGPTEIELCERHRSVQEEKKKSTIVSGSVKIQGHPWPRIRTWPARTQQPAGSLFVSVKELDSMASWQYWLQTNTGAWAERPSCSFARGTSHNSTGALCTCF